MFCADIPNAPDVAPCDAQKIHKRSQPKKNVRAQKINFLSGSVLGFFCAGFY
eukprot:NODE_8012_length_301_cov_13.837302_g7274_i0.p1 GENE.NODE_8012_length_301_cov_13.837302_g7274_i0~~NODE_8012_length_301_cov_13.837302_g7274_i0.p1  ORF type:complete len:52 (+),score=2.74 NODE_8012_length_301_cov_13.837302_g7274_i0:108-263(+)